MKKLKKRLKEPVTWENVLFWGILVVGSKLMSLLADLIVGRVK